MKRIAKFVLILFFLLLAFLSGWILSFKYAYHLPAKPVLNNEEILKEINDFRVSNGLEKLIESPELCQLAEERAKYIQENNTPALYDQNRHDIAHGGLEQFQSRYSGQLLLEDWQNLNTYTNEGIVLRFLNSKDHRNAILYSPFKEGCVRSYQDVLEVFLGQPGNSTKHIGNSYPN